MENTPLKCFVKSNACPSYKDLAQALILIIVPVILMIVFGFCTIRNIHQSRQRMTPSNINEQFMLRNQ